MKVAKIQKNSKSFLVPEVVKGEGTITFSLIYDSKARERAIKVTENRLLADGWGLHKGYKIVIQDGEKETVEMVYKA